MASQNLEALRRATDAFNARDLDGFLSQCDPDIELQSRFSVVGGTAHHHGHEGVRRWHQDLTDAWEYLQVELERLIEIDDETVLSLAFLHGRGRGSGVEIREPIAHLQSYRDGKLKRFLTYTNRAEALDAVGLSE